MNLKTITLFVLLLISSIFAQEVEYIWPTDASRAFTSSFAEYRPGRFHAGVDVKTWGRTGYELYAIRDGYISRVRVSPFGYGKCLYLTLDTGETVVYGHMDRFIKEIEDYMWGIQQSRNNYDVQSFPPASKFQFKQGDLIGYSGQTGVGYPHLHFEMRNKAGRPFNPLEKGYKVEDYTAPVISKIAFTPMDAFSMVNNNWDPVVMRTKELRDRYYIVDHPVKVNGLVGFAFSAFDQMDNITNKFGTYKNQLYIDEKLVFSSIYKQFSYDENHLAILDRDFRLNQWGQGNFYQLYRDFGNSLPFYFSKETYYGVIWFAKEYDPDYRPFAGVKAMYGDSHSFRMVAQDFWGNTSQVGGKILVDETSPVLQNSRTLNKLLTNNLTLPDSQLFTTDHVFYDKYLRIRFQPTGDMPDSLAVDYRFSNNISKPLSFVKQNGHYQAAIPLNVHDQGPITVEWLGILNGEWVRQKEKIYFVTVPNQTSKIVTTTDDSCQVVFSARSLYRPVYFRYEKAPAEQNSDYTFASNVYTLHPQDVPMLKGATVKIRIARYDSLAEKIGIYYKVPGHSKWRYFGNQFDAVSNSVAGNVGTFGTHALIVDTDPPELMYLSPANNSHVNGATVKLRAVFNDKLSGINSEKDREMRLNGKKVIAEYDPEHLTLVYKPRTPLEKGKYELEIFLRDRCNNVTTQTRTFWVD